ncbi:MAG: hypothetical protein JKY99_00335 [Rhizobiales bacterium]|nr:hypothetical protein [Hyphomicrobiales bacterium]
MKPVLFSFAALGLSCSFLSVVEANNGEYVVAPGVIIGAKALYLTPYFESDIYGVDDSVGGSNDMKELNFVWDGQGAYRVWGGYETASGLGFTLGHMGLNASSDNSRARGAGNLKVFFQPGDGNTNMFVLDTLHIKNKLNLNVTDLDIWQKINLPNMMLRFGAGLRYASLDRNILLAEATGGEFLNFNHSFKGIGPSLGYEVEIPVANGFSLYNSGRAALLFGEHKSNYYDEPAANNSGSSQSNAMLPTLDGELGLQWRGHLGALSGELTVRAGVEVQAWINGGGWDLFDQNADATFPQHAGSFGLQGFSISAQYKFGTGDAEHTFATSRDAVQIVTPGIILGAKALYLTPYFESDTLGIDKNADAAGSMEVLSFDWDGQGAYRVWGGYETASGFGFTLAHMGLNASTDFSQAEGTGTLEVDFDPGSDDTDVNVDGTLNVKNTLNLNVSDFELWQKVKLPNMMLRYSAGLRYASFDRSFRATETGGSEFVNFDHSFEGMGPSFGYEVEIPVANGFSFYNSGRAALLFGEHKSNYDGEQPSDTGYSQSKAMLPTLDAELGLQWRGHLGALSGELTVRAGIEAQAWISGGGWGMAQDGGGADFPQNAGSFGLQGLSISAQYKFGAGDAEQTIETGREAVQIVTPGVIVGAKALYLTPYFERDVLGADEATGGPSNVEVLSFDWDGQGAYRIWGGYETASGFGFTIGHMGLNASTDFSQVEGAGRSLRVLFDPFDDDVQIGNVDGTLNVQNTLNLKVIDLDVWQKVKFSRMMLRYGAGLRYASFDRSFRATETGGSEFVNFDHSFKGMGPSLGYEVEIPVAKGFSFYNSGRAALLFGEHKSNYQGENTGFDAGSSQNTAMLPTLDAELGLQWQGHLGALPGELTVRAGVEAQAWINGGGWDMYANTAGGDFPQRAGSFGLHGFGISAQYKFNGPS